VRRTILLFPAIVALLIVASEVALAASRIQITGLLCNAPGDDNRAPMASMSCCITPRTSALGWAAGQSTIIGEASLSITSRRGIRCVPTVRFVFIPGRGNRILVTSIGARS
jgi:hypothetical protein